eukprot:536212_1
MSQKDSDQTRFKINDRVFIHNLTKSKHLNNLIGIIQDVTSTIRYRVLIIHTNKIVAIKPQNIIHADSIHEIESILRHFAADEKTGMLVSCPGNYLPTKQELMAAEQIQNYHLMIKQGDYSGCIGPYCTMKYLLFRSSPYKSVLNFQMKYDDYDGKQYVINLLKTFPTQKLISNKLSLCLLEFAFHGFQRKVKGAHIGNIEGKTNAYDMMMVIIRCGNKFRIVQSFERNFSLIEELKARNWINLNKIQMLIQCIIDAVFSNNAKKAMHGFEKLYRYPLKVNKKQFKNRNTSGCFGIYVSTEADIKRFIVEGNDLITEMSKYVLKRDKNAGEFGQPKKRSCIVCEIKCKKICARCKKLWYCGPKHQKIHWNKEHRSYCLP